MSSSLVGLVHTLNINSFTLLIGLIGPGIVAVVTGLQTPSWFKALLSVIIGAGVACGIVYFNHGFGADYVTNIAAVLTVWQSAYGMVWKGTGVAEWLQANFPVALGANLGDLFYIPTGVPVQTDNSVRPIDGEQPPQDPNYVHDFTDESQVQ